MEKNSSNHLKEIVEIVGVVSIVTSLLLVAWEIRQTNRITSAGTALELSAQLNAIDRDRVSSVNVAKLYPKLRSPESHLVTATESSQMEGLAGRYISVLAAAQEAYDERLLDRGQFERYVRVAQSVVEEYPGLHPYLLSVSESRELRSLPILQPIAELAEQSDEAPENQ